MRYNLKGSIVQNSDYCCHTCLTIDILDTLQMVGEYECIDIYCKSDVVTELIRNLLSVDFDGNRFTLGMIELDGAKADYEDEYILSINDDLTIWCQEVWNGDKLIDGGAELNFVSDDCDPRIIKKLTEERARTMQFTVGEEDDDFDDEDEFEPDEFEDDEVVDLYDLVESMVDAILDERYGKFKR